MSHCEFAKASVRRLRHEQNSRKSKISLPLAIPLMVGKLIA
jgi:hypothetical protein